MACPLCTQPSAKIHRRYTRTLADLPCMNTAVRLQVEVRRFFCGNALCPRKTFAEPFADLAAAYARRMSRQSELLRAIAVARRRQARGSSEQGMQDSSEPAYLVRVLRRAPVPAWPTPRVPGVDDWSIRKGQTYATLLVDLEAHRVVDVLPDREADTFDKWLKSHHQEAGTFLRHVNTLPLLYLVGLYLPISLSHLYGQFGAIPCNALPAYKKKSCPPEKIFMAYKKIWSAFRHSKKPEKFFCRLRNFLSGLFKCEQKKGCCVCRVHIRKEEALGFTFLPYRSVCTKGRCIRAYLALL